MNDSHPNFKDLFNFNNEENSKEVIKEDLTEKTKPVNTEETSSILDKEIDQTLKESRGKGNRYFYIIGGILTVNILLFLLSRELLLDIDNLTFIFEVGEWLLSILGFQFLIILVLILIFYIKGIRRKTFIGSVIQSIFLLAVIIGIYFGIQYDLTPWRIVTVTITIFLGIITFVGMLIYTNGVNNIQKKRKTQIYYATTIIIAILIGTNYVTIQWEEQGGFGAGIGYSSTNEVITETFDYINKFAYDPNAKLDKKLIAENRVEHIQNIFRENYNYKEQLDGCVDIECRMLAESRSIKLQMIDTIDVKNEEGRTITKISAERIPRDANNNSFLYYIEIVTTNKNDKHQLYDWIILPYSKDSGRTYDEIEADNLQKEIEKSEEVEDSEKPELVLGFTEYATIQSNIEWYFRKYTSGDTPSSVESIFTEIGLQEYNSILDNLINEYEITNSSLHTISFLEFENYNNIIEQPFTIKKPSWVNPQERTLTFVLIEVDSGFLISQASLA